MAIAAVGCMKKSDSTMPSTGGGGAAAADAKPFGDTMADAPMHAMGATVTAAAGCSTSGYAKFDIAEGAPAKMTVTVEGPAGTCMSVHYLKGNGGAVDGMMKELCVDKNGSETWDVTGQEGGSFIQMSEAPPCKGATITIALAQ